jgi:hypothetical protein
MFREKRRIQKDVKLATSHKKMGGKKASSCKFQFHNTNAMGDKILQIHILPDLLKKNLKL